MAEYSISPAIFPHGSMEEEWYREVQSSDAFCAIHLPGLQIPFNMPISLNDVHLERFTWMQWVLFERSDEASRLKIEFDHGLHTFLTCRVSKEIPLKFELDSILLQKKKSVQDFTSALRLLKEGTIIDPSSSVQYVRKKDRNLRHIGTYGRGLIEANLKNKYMLDAKTLSLLPVMIEALTAHEVTDDPTIGLAIRSFDRSYGYSLEHDEKLAFLFSALEATFGEYRKQSRPKPRISIGKAASLVSCAANTASIAIFLDDAEKGKKLRNLIAHGSTESVAGISCDIEVTLREIIRDGLRCLIIFAAQKTSFENDLDSIQVGLSHEPAKLAFQILLGYAGNGNATALKILTHIKAPFRN